MDSQCTPSIYIFEDRIEIISTGWLPFGYSEDDFYRCISRPVNNGLFKIMGQLGIVEQTGHGNLVIVDKYGKKAFEIADNHITVTIQFAFAPSMRQIITAKLSRSEASVLMAIKDNPTANKIQLAKICNLGTTRISEITAKLKEIGKNERVGSKKNGYWIVL